MSEKEELSLSAYYFHFNPTGVREIDEILAAIAAAGKAYHLTADWHEECDVWRPSTVGKTPIEWIQNAADRAAKNRRASESSALEKAVVEAAIRQDDTAKAMSRAGSAFAVSGTSMNEASKAAADARKEYREALAALRADQEESK